MSFLPREMWFIRIPITQLFYVNSCTYYILNYVLPGAVPNAVGINEYVRGSHHIYAVLVGLCSSIFGGVSYCLTKAGAKTTDQPV